MNNFIFFGSDDFSIEVLDTLIKNGFKPKACVTQPDKRKGRNMEMSSPLIKKYCEEEKIPVLQIESLTPATSFIGELKLILENAERGSRVKPGMTKETGITKDTIDFFVVASFGKIIPKEILEIPKFGSINVHPSLLPKYRGASPIESVILNDEKETGVSIILMDEKMDHGPIFGVTRYTFDFWPDKTEMRKTLARIGGEMLVDIIPKWLNGEIKPTEQNHDKATFTKMLKKEDGEIKIENSEQEAGSRKDYLKYLAYNPWPGVFFFTKDKKRVKVTKAKFEDDKFIIEKVIPEGRKEMSWEDFKNGFSNKS